MTIELAAQRRKGLEWARQGEENAERRGAEIVQHDLDADGFEARDDGDARGILENAERGRTVAELLRSTSTFPPGAPCAGRGQPFRAIEIDRLADLERDQNVTDAATDDGRSHALRRRPESRPGRAREPCRSG